MKKERLKIDMDKLNVIDLFAGAGGLSLGFQKTEMFNIVAAVEKANTEVPEIERLLKELIFIRISEMLILMKF